MLRIFTPVKIQRLRPGLNPQTWVPEDSMLTTRPPKPSLSVGRSALDTAEWEKTFLLPRVTTGRLLATISEMSAL